MAELQALDHRHPAVFSAMVQLAIWDSDQQQILNLVRRASKIEPLYWPIYTQAMQGLLPRWGGTISEMQSLLQLIDTQVPEAYRDEFYYRVALDLFDSWVADYARYNIDWPRVRKGFADMQARYTISDEWRHRMASIAYVERDFEAMRSFLSQTNANGNDLTKKSIDVWGCLLYTSPSPRDQRGSRMPSSA